MVGAMERYGQMKHVRWRPSPIARSSAVLLGTWGADRLCGAVPERTSKATGLHQDKKEHGIAARRGQSAAHVLGLGGRSLTPRSLELMIELVRSGSFKFGIVVCTNFGAGHYYYYYFSGAGR